MASKNKTNNYGLNQWAKTDAVLMDDFNADNQKIDAAIKDVYDSIPKIAYGSYAGNGEYGMSKKTSLSFEFAPRLVCVNGMVIIKGCSDMTVASGICYFTWTGNTLNMYSPQGAAQQMNAEGKTYYYWAIE